MAFSDDEEETVPNAITNYHFEDKDGAPISFSVLPLILDDAEDAEAPRQHVSVRGTTDGGLQSVFKEVIAWKLNLGEDDPQVSVLSKENKWIKLEKPKKSFEECIRPTLITIHLLHFSKKNPEASIKSSWEHLRHVLGPFDDRPFDLSDHVQLVKLYMERDESLSNSQVLPMVVKNPENAFGENFTNGLGERPFIIDDELEYGIGVDEGDGDESEDESDLFDSVCSICDNGGELLCCEGRCLRSFHATKRAGEDSDCASLGLTRTQVDAMQNFLCKNCQLKKHQCFACGKLGSSDKSASAEVFSCVSATCGHFYHPKCVAHLLFPENKVEATELEIKIAAGQSFTCPVHRCIVCKQVENKEVEELQFAICRRCPKAYHRKCMPREISFEDIEDEDIIQRAWEGLLPNRILIYCMKHDIDDELGTPARDHIIFAESLDKKRERDQLKPKLKKDKQASDSVTGDINLAKHVKKIEKKAADGSHNLKVAKALSKQAIDSSQPTWKASMKVAKSALEKVESKEIAKSALTKMEKPKLKIERASVDKAKVSDVAVNVHGKLKNSAPKIPDEIRKDVLALVEEESSSLTLEEIKKTLLMPSTHAFSAGQIDKSITLGKVEGAIEAVRTALEKLDAGGNVEDARAVCEPEILKRLIKWNTKLKVYLAPVLHGSRYSSYGRHFTKSDKLQEISDKLQWYVQDGDMVVDFCCGANEFSLLMKEKLDAAGKKCSFKNYDIFQAKNDFNFEMRDWMTVRPRELPTGSKLIMGLNPPFGVNARLANQFIDKALTFKPKLLILIVPEETRRLDQKNPRYDLIWEDRESLSGKSFYLPGSIDICDKQIEQWNLKPPVLYLWSRPDWTAKHKSIASSQGHTSKLQPALVYKDSPSRTEEHAAAVYKSSEEQYMECDATLVESVSIKQNKAISRDSSSNVEPVVPIDALSQVERDEDASRAERHAKERYDTARSSPELREPRKDANKKKHTQESHGKRESTPAHNVSTREAHKKKLHSDEKTDKNRSADGKKRKSPDRYNDKTVSSNKMKHWEQHRHETSSRMEMEDVRDMSISPRDGREPIDVSASGSFDHSSGLEMRSRSSVGRPSSIHDGIDDISRKYLTPERGWSGTAAVQEKDLIPNSDGRYGAYGNLDNYSQPHVRNSYSRPDDADLRSQIRTYGVQDEEIANGYGRLSEAELRAQLRTYGLQEEEATNGYRRPSDADIRTQLRMYGRQELEVEPGIGYGRPSEVTLRTQHRPYGIQTEEDHLQGSRYPLGGSVSTLGHSSLYPSSNYRFSGVAAETSTLQRYAPRLDERNYSRPRSVPGRDVHGFRGEFSSGSIPPFPHQDSTGWIDD